MHGPIIIDRDAFTVARANHKVMVVAVEGLKQIGDGFRGVLDGGIHSFTNITDRVTCKGVTISDKN